MLPEKTFEDQVSIVTGGGSGIGLAVATEIARLGGAVVLAGRKPERLDAAVADLTALGAKALAQPTDVRQPEQVDALVEAALAWGGRVDMLVNSAAGNFLVDADQLSVNGWLAVVNTVLNGSFFCTRAVGREMIKAQRGGRIVSIVASYAWTGGPHTVHSASAKAGVVAMTRTLAVEWARHGLRVNAVCPGPTDTEGARPLWQEPAAHRRLLDSIPVGRFARAEEIAQATTYLLSPYADYVNGEVFVIDGGEWLGKGLS